MGIEAGIAGREAAGLSQWGLREKTAGRHF